MKNNTIAGNVIEMQDVTKMFGEEIAVQSLTMAVPHGSIFGFVGPSGCGKTTTVRLLTGFYQPTSGKLSVLGKDPAHFTQADREKIGYLIQQFVLYPNLTVWENLNFVASFYGVSSFRGRHLNKLLDFVELSEHKYKLAGDLSGGMKRRLSLAAALVHKPELLFLDEPTAGIDPILRRKFWDYFKELQAEGHTLFITTQYVGEAADCDLVGVMYEGRLLMIETPDGLRKKAYGGDVVGIKTTEGMSFAQRHELEALPFVHGKIKVIDEQENDVIVDGASTAIPALIEWCQAQNLNVEMIEKSSPPFDDVFVKIIEMETAHAKALIRISSFVGKELTEIFRQPKLVLTLVLGPFLIMSLFGLAYPDKGRPLRTTFVTTDPDAFQEQIKLFTETYSSTILDQGLETNKELAIAKLARSETDMVIVIPDQQFETIQNNQQAKFQFYHNEVDPGQIGYIQAVARIYVDEINRQILQLVAEQGQANSGSVQSELETAIEKTQALRQVIPPGDVTTAAQAAELEQDLTDVNEKLSLFRSVTSGILVRPFTAEVNGLSSVKFTTTGFFAPAVIVLLLQHLSITFASFSIVREKRSGIMELFRVAPITAFETMLGKYISYLFFEIILAGIITALAIWLLHIPILGHWQDYTLAVISLLFTSLGVGFLISLISETDTQAVQYSMLLLLASIFFSGFFLDLRLMREPITVLAWSLPATYGIRMLQDIMLRGTSATPLIFVGVLGIGILLFLLDWRLLKRRMES